MGACAFNGFLGSEYIANQRARGIVKRRDLVRSVHVRSCRSGWFGRFWFLDTIDRKDRFQEGASSLSTTHESNSPMRPPPSCWSVASESYFVSVHNPSLKW